MVDFPNAKINIGLNIVSKRPDVYHNLQTVFYPVPLYDVLEVLESNNDTFTIIDNDDESLTKNNLCLDAVQLLRKDYKIPPLKIILKKNIPMGAGMGGGSADASFMLKLLNEKFNLKIPESKLAQYALQLGADCPFFIYNAPMYAEGIGEKFTPVKISLKGMWMCIVFPNLHVSTKEAFAGITPARPDFNLKELEKLPIEDWKDKVINDFEKPAFEKYPQLKRIKDKLYENGALYASMTGSGSAFYGIYNTKMPIDFEENYVTKWVQPQE